MLGVEGSRPSPRPIESVVSTRGHSSGSDRPRSVFTSADARGIVSNPFAVPTLIVAVCALWLYAVPIEVITQLSQGRQSLATATSIGANAPPVVITLRQAALLVTISALGLGVLANVATERRIFPWRLAILTLPAIALQLAAVFNGSGIGLAAYAYVLMCAHFCTTEKRAPVLPLISILTITTASIAIAMAAVFPTAALVARGTSVDVDSKAIIGALLLAGPFASPNTLGSALVVGVPAILYAFPGRSIFRILYIAGLLSVCMAIVWSASRTAIFALVIVAIVFIFARLNLRIVAALTVVATALTAALLPFFNLTPSAFTGRGQIWIGSLSSYSQSPIFGLGPDFYGQEATVDSDLGPTAFHGHDVLINALATGGIVFALSIAMVYASICVLNYTLANAPQRCAMVWLAMIIGLGILEVPFDFRNAAATAWAVWPMLSFGITAGIAATVEMSSRSDSPPDSHSQAKEA